MRLKDSTELEVEVGTIATVNCDRLPARNVFKHMLSALFLVSPRLEAILLPDLLRLNGSPTDQNGVKMTIKQDYQYISQCRPPAGSRVSTLIQKFWARCLATTYPSLWSKKHIYLMHL